MRFATTTRGLPATRGLARWLAIAVMAVAVSSLVPRPAHAQQSEIKKLVEKASSDYDMLEIGPAKKKLEKAVKLAEREGISGPAVARAYVMSGVVAHGADKDKQAALSAFKSALKADSEASIPSVYKTPALEKLMEEARESVDLSETEQESGQTESEDQRQVDGFTHEPVASVEAGKPLSIEASVPEQMSVDRVNLYFRRYDQDEWTERTLEATDATRYATEIAGHKIYTSQIVYYLEAVDGSGGTVATSGDARNPHTVTVLGSAGFDPEKAKQEAMAENQESQQQTSPGATDPNGGDDKTTPPPPEDDSSSSGADPIVYLDFGGGSGGGLLTKYSDENRPPPTANPGRELDAGLAPAFGHATFGLGGLLNESMSLGLYFRWQFSPSQNFEEIRSRNVAEDGQQLYSGFKNGECLGTGLPGDCLLGLKYRWFFSSGPKLRMFSAVGAGVGRLRHWVRLKERASNDFCADKKIHKPSSADKADFCYRTDTVRPGWMHFGIGGGVTYEINEVFALLGEAYIEVLFPDTAVNLDINIGPQFRF